MVGQVILLFLHAALAFKQSKVAFALKDNTNLLILDSVYIVRADPSMSRVSAMSRATVRRHDVEQQKRRKLGITPHASRAVSRLDKKGVVKGH
jgi:hypothetical protein